MSGTGNHRLIYRDICVAATAHDTWRLARDFDEGVELRRRDVVVVAKRGVRGVHELAQLVVVTSLYTTSTVRLG